MATFTNTRKFRLKILACMLKPSWMSTYGTIIKPAYFESKDEHDLAKCLADYWEVYRQVPEDVDDIEALLGEDAVEYHDLTHSVYLGARNWDLTLAADMAVKFAKEQAAKLAVLESLEDIQRGELDSVVARLKQAMEVGRDIGYKGIDLVANVEQWLRYTSEDKLPTGMIHLDIAMGGGLSAGELGVFLAPPNYGKSMALINAGYGAIGPISACNVVHFTFEMEAEVIAKRYGARATFRFPQRDAVDDYRQDFDAIAELMMFGDIRIFRVSGNINVIKQHLNILLDEGFDIGLIIVDYGDLVDPVRRRPDRWVELGEVFQDLRELGHEYGCPVWSATQTGRHAVNKEIITMSDLAESFKKAHICDAIVAICQTIDEERANQCRLFIAKLRDGASRAMIRAKFYKEQQAIITTGFVDPQT